MKRLVVAALIALELGASTRPTVIPRASAVFQTAPAPYLPGSVVPIAVNGLNGPYRVALLGPGSLDGHVYRIPDDATGSAFLLASNAGAVAQHTFVFAPPLDPRTGFLAVASYDDGVIVHHLRAPFAMTAALGIGGAPGDVAIAADGTLASGATDGDTATFARLQPWGVTQVANVPFTDALAFDDTTHALFVTDRDVDGVGALTRVDRSGTTARRTLGSTAEGLAIDAARRRVYVANTNDGTISIVDADSLVEIRRFAAVARVFSLALSPDGSRLYAVSNQSLGSPFGAAGSAVAFDVRGARPRIVARSAALSFPLGVALDAARKRVFVTDERDDVVDVLDARTLAALRAPLRTCRTPWKPTVDGDRLFVPCARADEIDVFDLRTLRRVPGAPFATGGYPLAVAVWSPH